MNQGQSKRENPNQSSATGKTNALGKDTLVWSHVSPISHQRRLNQPMRVLIYTHTHNKHGPTNKRMTRCSSKIPLPLTHGGFQSALNTKRLTLSPKRLTPFGAQCEVRSEPRWSRQNSPILQEPECLAPKQHAQKHKRQISYGSHRGKNLEEVQFKNSTSPPRRRPANRLAQFSKEKELRIGSQGAQSGSLPTRERARTKWVESPACAKLEQLTPKNTQCEQQLGRFSAPNRLMQQGGRCFLGRVPPRSPERNEQLLRIKEGAALDRGHPATGTGSQDGSP